MKLRISNKPYFVILACIILFGSYLRLYNLGAQSFWPDELDFVEAAKSMSKVGKPLLRSGYAYSRAPLVTYSLIPSFNIFGISEFSTRLPVAVFGILTIPMIFIVGRRFFNERVGIIAALLLACAPFAVGWARVCRMYSLFQLLFLAGLYFFFIGFEANCLAKDHHRIHPHRFLPRMAGKLLNKWEMHLPSLLLGGVLLVASYSTHQCTGFFLISLTSYLLLLSLYHVFKDGIVTASTTKYTQLFGLIVLIGTLTFLFLPSVRGFFNYAITYLPKWAEDPTAQNRWQILSFVFGRKHFPVNVLFVFGTFYVVQQWNKAGIYTFLNLSIPIILFSFAFKYRKNDYIFHVYPLFLLLASVALSKLVELISLLSTHLTSNRGTFNSPGISRIRDLAILGMCLAWVPFTYSFRFALHIPRLPDGTFNGAVYHNEWKEVSTYFRNKLEPGHVLISTLPLTVQHYVGRADYNLNLSSSDMARRSSIYSPDGRLIDFYSGADVVEDLHQLKLILKKHPNGWFLADRYRLATPVYVPPDIHRFVNDKMSLAFLSKRRSVLVYRWSEEQPTFEFE